MNHKKELFRRLWLKSKSARQRRPFDEYRQLMQQQSQQSLRDPRLFVNPQDRTKTLSKQLSGFNRSKP